MFREGRGGTYETAMSLVRKKGNELRHAECPATNRDKRQMGLPSSILSQQRQQYVNTTFDPMFVSVQREY